MTKCKFRPRTGLDLKRMTQLAHDKDCFNMCYSLCTLDQFKVQHVLFKKFMLSLYIFMCYMFMLYLYLCMLYLILGTSKMTVEINF